MTRHHIRPVTVTVNDDCRSWSCSRVVVTVDKPKCCGLNSKTLLYLLCAISLLFSLVALVLHIIFEKHWFFILLHGFNVVAILVTIFGLVKQSSWLLAIALSLSILMLIGCIAGAVYCILTIILEYPRSFHWRLKTYYITMTTFEIAVIIPQLAICFLTSEIFAYYRKPATVIER
ncbi:unnamed protein product [Caenorhabditis auriculariae]|uniref:Uncharacterized protein n=1 Tax=Caenorhabditis auriculariae TaxID=2777116 RepID=A0A8S1GXC1_9PELO|nr:unnamed protein product [Caenorhabditis auriculariae]